MAQESKERVGIVGVGRMGFAMLGHLIKHGYSVTACDLNAQALEKSRAAGAAAADSPAALARQSDFVIIGVGYTDECTTFSVQYSESFTNSVNVRDHDQTLIFQLTLRTLGEAKTTTDLGESTSKLGDGVFH